MLGHELSVNVDQMEDAIYLVIEGKTFADRVADHVGGNDIGVCKVLWSLNITESTMQQFRMALRIMSTMVVHGVTKHCTP